MKVYLGALDNVVLVLYGLAAFAVLLGVASIIIGFVKFGGSQGETKESASYTASKGSRSASATGFIAWPIFGVVMIVGGVLLFIYRVDPALGDHFRPLPHVSKQVAFKTPTGVVCSTYTDRDAMACVITNHSWGEVDCPYVFTLPRKGEATVEQCPRKSQLKALSGMAKAPPTRGYGQTYDFAVARCFIASEGAYCVNSDRHYIRVSRDVPWPKP